MNPATRREFLQAVHRRRRIICNNDGDDIWAKGADSVEKFPDKQSSW